MDIKRLPNKISNGVKTHLNDILLFFIVLLLCLLAFGAGMLCQFYLQKPPLIIETPAGE